MKVKVKQGLADHFIGFFDHARRRPGDVFTVPDTPRRLPSVGEQRMIESDESVRVVFNDIKDKDGKVPQAFSFKWMEPVAMATPERVSTSQQALDARSEEIKQEKAGQRALDGGGEADVI